MSTPVRPGLRWAVPAGVTALVLGGAVLGPALTASAEVELPERTPQRLLTDLQTADVDAFSGTVTHRAELGLPEIPDPMGGGPGGEHGEDPLSLLTGSHELRVWASGDKARVALHGRMGESDVVTDGEQVWTWSSEDRTATHLVLPDDGSHADAQDDLHADLDDRRDAALSDAMPALTPDGVTDLVLDRLEPTTAVSAGPNTLVAGRPAYTLVLEPKAEASLVGSIRIAVDAGERVPTRVQVFATGATTPAVEVAFTSLSFEEPDDSVFRFTPPAGATVEEKTLEGHHGPGHGDLGGTGTGTAAGTDTGAGPAAEAVGPKPGAVVGTGWDAVVVTRVPGGIGEAEGDLAALLQTLPRVSGEWGSGRLLTSALFTALLTDDGRLLVGAVDQDRVLAAAGDPAADLG